MSAMDTIVGPPPQPTSGNVTVVPVSTGTTGGSGSGMGTLSIMALTTGFLGIPLAVNNSGSTGGDPILVGPAVVNGAGSSVGMATTFGSGMASGTNFIGTGSGSGTSAATGVAGVSGAITLNQMVFNVMANRNNTFLGVNGTTFTAMTGVNSNFNNAGSGTFGNPGTLYIP
jgi:hypothetical protein